MQQVTVNETQVKLKDLTKTVIYCEQQKSVTDLIEELQTKDTGSCPPSSILALYLIHDLFSEKSSNQANVERITTNLEAAAEDLYRTSRFVRSLAQ